MSVSTLLISGATNASFFLQEGEFNEDIVSPGVAGFLVTALVALVIIFLGFDLVRRLRRSRYRHEIRELIADEVAERDAEAQRGAETEPDTEAATLTENSEADETQPDADQIGSTQPRES